MAEMKLTVSHIDEKIDGFIEREEKVDCDQFDLLREHGERIAATQKEVSLITAKMANGGIPARIKIPWRKVVLGIGLTGSGGAAILTWASDVLLFIRDNALDLFLK